MEQVDRLPYYLCVPPYTTLVEWRLEAGGNNRRLPVGAVAVVPRLEPAQMNALARAQPAATFVVALRNNDALYCDDLRWLRPNGVGAIVVTGETFPHLGEILVAARRSAEPVAGHIRPRLFLLDRRMPRAFEGALEQLVGDSAMQTVERWAAALGTMARTLERYCTNEWSLPSPRRWVELVRAIRLVRALQVKPDAVVEGISAKAGFENATTARTLLKRVCGKTPRAVRGVVGWYWILDAWQHRYWPRLTGWPRGTAGARK